MKIKYNLEALEHIISDLSLLTGVSIAFLDTDFNCLILQSKRNDYCSILQKDDLIKDYCNCSDREILLKSKQSRSLETHICHAGLCDSAMPIIKNGIITGYIIFGRIRTAFSPQKQIYCDNRNEIELLDKRYRQLTYFTEKQINSFYDLLPRILFQQAIEIENDSFITNVLNYIENNLQADLHISSICKKFFVSKNRLYEVFRDYYGCTVNEYITELRIKKAKDLLENSKEPVYKIAEEVGINNYTYFCKLFKRKTKLSPSEYRKASLN